MKLYDDPRAPNPRRVRMFLAEKGLELQRESVDIGARANLDPRYLAKNPLGLVPALELDDGSILTESVAICRYLEELHPEPALFGRTPLERARVEQWNRIAELEVLFRVAMTFQNESPYWLGRREQSPEFAGFERTRLLGRLDLVETHLTGRDYLVGDALTIADITLFVGLDFGRIIKVKPDESRPNLLAFHQRMAARPSAKA